MTTVADILNTMDYGPSPESAQPAQDWLSAHHRRFDHFIAGAWVPPVAGQRFEVRNPADGTLLAEVAQGDAADIAAAVAAAQQAQPAWAALGGHGRARYLYAIARHVQKQARLLAVLETLDNGKTIRESRDIDLPLVVRHFYHHAGWADLLASELPGQVALGVCGQIVPWNFPLLMLAWKVAPALAAGNTVVLKPAEFTPLTALAFAEICTAVGLPPGVVNIVTGDGDTGAALVRHPQVAKIAFTGSTEVGRLIRRATAGSGKKLSLELGGKSPFIVFDDADLDAAVEGVVDSIWFNQGQVCCAGSRILVQEAVAERFALRLRARMAKLRVGPPLDKSSDMGAIVDRVQWERIAAMVAQGRSEGLTCWQPALPDPGTGWFYPPTFFEDVPPASALAQQEIFGPVVVSLRFRTLDEAVALANNSRYGLAASVWSENINVALTVAAQLQAGVVWINAANLFDAAAGFGGYRESGFGREGGREGLLEYLQPAWGLGLPPLEEASPQAVSASPPGLGACGMPAIDRSAKFYIGGKQTRPDSGYSFGVTGADGRMLGQAGQGNRKDIRNAVEAAHKAGAWGRLSGHARAQVLYYLAENLSARADSLAAHLQAIEGGTVVAAQQQVARVLQRVFFYAGFADKFDGRTHATVAGHITLAMPEPFGVVGLRSPSAQPLLALVSLLLPLMAAGNRVVLVPPPATALLVADLYQVLDTSDLPAGVVNLVCGEAQDDLAEVLALHDDVQALWYAGPMAGAARMQLASAGNLKSTAVWTQALDWADPVQGQGIAYLQRATQVKNIWIPYGE